MMNNTEVAVEFVRGGRKGKGSNMFIEGDVIYSWGRHFPIAVRIAGGVLFNADRYSNSTSKHQLHVRRALSTFGVRVTESTTSECFLVMNSKTDGVPVVLERVVQPRSLSEVERVLSLFLKKNGVRQYNVQAKRLSERIAELSFIARI